MTTQFATGIAGGVDGHTAGKKAVAHALHSIEGESVNSSKVSQSIFASYIVRRMLTTKTHSMEFDLESVRIQHSLAVPGRGFSPNLEASNRVLQWR